MQQEGSFASQLCLYEVQSLQVLSKHPNANPVTSCGSQGLCNLRSHFVNNILCVELPTLVLGTGSRFSLPELR